MKKIIAMKQVCFLQHCCELYKDKVTKGQYEIVSQTNSKTVNNFSQDLTYQIKIENEVYWMK